MRTVTGSAHVVEVAGKRILLDCGMYQGKRDEARAINERIPTPLTKLDAVILSHGHLDHCGKLPVLPKAGYKGPIWCTSATAEVSRVVLTDSAEIQTEDAEYLNRRVRRADEPPIKPLYTTVDVNQVMRQFRSIDLSKRVELFPTETGDARTVGFTFFEAGHILGSAYVLLDWSESGKKRSLLFTADVGRYNTPIIRDPVAPPGPVDFLITESTYGGRIHGPMVDVEPEFEALLKQTIENRSRLLIPSFAVGRTQTMLWYVSKLIAAGKIPPIRVYIDSPMGVDLTRIYTAQKDYWDDETRNLISQADLFGMKNVTLASTSEQSKMINADKGPCVIIASSPTCEFGRILHHLKTSIERRADQLLFVGWTPPRTLGRRLQDGETRVRIFDRYYDVRIQVKTLPGMSAHGDSDELLKFVKPAIKSDTKAFVVHGEPEQSEIFAGRLKNELGVASAVVPAPDSSVIEDAPTVSRGEARTDGD
ncbi:MAG: MBL fold metallo-hydrolase [Tepidisphaeraceae bacterium]